MRTSDCIRRYCKEGTPTDGGHRNRSIQSGTSTGSQNYSQTMRTMKWWNGSDMVGPQGGYPHYWIPELQTRTIKGPWSTQRHLGDYITKEQSQGAVMGPYHRIPFPKKVGISPLSTRPKMDSPHRRIILDLSFPPGNAVNDGIMKDDYMGLPAKLTFPWVDDFAIHIYTLGKGCMMFKIDLSRYFRQLPLDPGDYSLIGYVINGDIYFDKVLPMGHVVSTLHRTASHQCYRIHTQEVGILPAQLCR